MDESFMANHEFAITTAESRTFALLSGDYNPLHLDPIVARRLITGSTVVHGVHSVLRAIDMCLSTRTAGVGIKNLSAWFLNPIVNNQSLRCEATLSDCQHLKIELFEGTRKLLVASADLMDVKHEDAIGEALPTAHVGSSKELTFAEASNASGSVRLSWDDSAGRKLFPNLVRCVPIRQLAQIVASTRIVGMECPGLNSIFTKLKLRTKASPESGNEFRYSVKRAHERLSFLMLSVAGPDFKGELETFYRQPPVAQPSYVDVAQSVTHNEFAGQRALVIGGSRGLGEVIAKAIVAGGGEACITYNTGREDALRVQQEIRNKSGVCYMCEFDVLQPPSVCPADVPLSWMPTHVYYLATPTIGLTRTFEWDARRFQQFCDFYVNGLRTSIAAIRQIWRLSEQPLDVLHPSTVLLDSASPIAAEYAVAKSAAEAMCRFLEHEQQGTRCHSIRWPRMMTDQTNSLVSAKSDDTIQVLLSTLRTMCRRVSAKAA